MTQLGRERSVSRSNEAAGQAYSGETVYSGEKVHPGGADRSGDRNDVKDMQFLLNSFVSTLANFDLAYEEERRKVGRTIADPNVRLLVLERLKRRHWEKRDPYVRQLAILRDRIGRAAPRPLAG
jgi:hypothetical protein